MADRVDPIGGWFNLGDRKVDELPSSTEARATQPRTAESKSIIPPTMQQTIRFTPASIRPSSNGNSTFWDNPADYIRVKTAAAGFSLSFVFPFQFRIGTIINQLIFQSYETSGKGSVSVGFQARDENNPNASTTVSVTTTGGPTDGAWHKTSIDYASILGADRIIRSGLSYTGVVTMLPGATAVDDDLRLAWIDVVVSVPTTSRVSG